MLTVFVPLILLAVFSMFIFEIDNGLTVDNTGASQYTNITWRIVNVAATLFAYVSLIPVIRASLPPMPGFTLI